MKNVTRWNTSKPVVNSTFRNIKWESDYFDVITMNDGSHGNKFIDWDLRCKKASTAASVAIADACFTSNSMYGLGLMTHKGAVVDGMIVEGFPYPVYSSVEGVSFSNIKTINCSWSGSLLAPGATNFTLSRSNQRLENAVIINTNPVLKSKRYLAVATSQILNNVIVKNVTDSESVASCLPDTAISINKTSGSINNIYIENVYLRWSGSDAGTVNIDSGRFINQNIFFTEVYPVLRVAGTTTNRPANAPTGYMYYDLTLNKPVFKSTSSANTWVDATGATV